MLSSMLLHSTIISFLLTLNLCFAYLPGQTGGPPPSPTGPPSGPNPPGYDCNFEPPSGCGPDTTTPAYNECQIRDYSVTEFIQCAGETSTQTDNDGNSEAFNNVLGVLVSAVKIPKCNKCRISPFANYQAMGDKSEKLANYLCGKLDNNDICCLSACLGATKQEHGLAGICNNNDVNLFDNDVICDGSSGGGGGGGGAGDGDDSSDGSNNQAAASSSSTVANTPKPTSTSTPSPSPSPSPSPPTSSSIVAQTTSPIQTTTSAQTATSSPAGTSGSSAGSSIRAANVIALGILAVLLTAGIGRAL